MIVNYTEAGWEVITQRSHGLLAAQICAYWRKDRQPERWIETLIATAEHDDVYNELENGDLLTLKGGPMNFKQKTFDLEYNQRLMAMAETKSAYIALLIARHIEFVYGQEPAAETFIGELKAKARKWRKTAGCKVMEVSRGYELLEFSDAFSLLICQGLIQPEQRKIEISSGPDGVAYEIYAEAGAIVVEPWPFEADEFVVSWEVRPLEQLTFKDNKEFRAVFDSAEVQTIYLKLQAQR